MKRNLLISLFSIIYIIIYFSISQFIIKKSNSSVLYGYFLNLILLLLIIIFGILISKLFFNFRIKNFKVKKINIDNFDKNIIKNSIIFSLIILLVLFSTIYLFFYYKSNLFFDLFNITSGIKNSCSYIVKILFISIPLYSFEITYLEYCKFLNNITEIIKLKSLKLLSYVIFQLTFLFLFNFNWFLYSKLTIDIFFFGYYIIKLRDIIKLCSSTI